MDKANMNPNKSAKEEEFEYKSDKESFLIKLIFNSDEITFNIKNTKPYQCSYFESKFNFSELQKKNPFFCQFQNAEKIGNLYLNLLKGKKIKLLQQNNNSIELSFINITEEVVNLTINKKELKENEKLLEMIANLVNDVQELKKENKEMKEKIDELMQFKLKIEEIKKEEERKYHNFKNSSILKDKEKIKMISDWILPNRNIIYTQIYKASKDGATGTDFHRCCDNKGPTVTLIESTNGYIFGGYITITWEGPSSWIFKGNDEHAFVFSVNNKCKYPIQDKSKVIYNEKNYGPNFGNDDIYIKQNFYNDSSSCKNNSCYNLSPNNVAGGSSFTVKELEVYLVQFD